jgi:sterol 14-demethylase
MSEITIYTASRTLQGKEVRSRFNAVFANLFHDLDMGFTPINFMLHWFPLPQNRARDRAQRILAETYTEIIQERRRGNVPDENEHDLIRHLMASVYKDGTPVPDKEIAHMMIAMLMAGQHSSSSTSSWMMLNLAAHPEVIEELYQEQIRVLGADLPPLTYENIQKLTLNQAVLKETLRLHTPIHSILRKVKSPMPVPGTNYVVPTNNNLLSSAGVTARMEEYFPDPLKWDPHRWDAGAAGVRMGEVKEEHEDYGYGMISKGATSPYLPFGAGRHRCIGEQFAGLQLGTIIATMVREFKWRLPDGVTKVVDTDYSSLFSRPLTPAMIVWEKREKN